MPIFFGSVAPPYFIAELARGKHYFLSRALVFQFMHVDVVLNSMNSVYFILRSYLKKQIKADEVNYQLAISGVALPHSLNNIVYGCLILKLAYSLLFEDLKGLGII